MENDWKGPEEPQFWRAATVLSPDLDADQFVMGVFGL